MSVKIYNGLRAIGTNPFTVGKEIRAVLEPLFLEKADALVTQLQEHPELSLQEALALPDPMEKLYSEHKSVFAVISMLFAYPTHNFSPADIGYEVVLMPSAVDDRLLVLVFSEEHSYHEALLAAGVVEDFSYQDNSDFLEEDGVTPEEWEHRRKSWGHLIEDDETPATLGLMVKYPGSLAYMVWKIDRNAALRAKKKEK